MSVRENKVRVTRIMSFTFKNFSIQLLNAKLPLSNNKFTQLDIKSKKPLDIIPKETLRIRCRKLFSWIIQIWDVTLRSSWYFKGFKQKLLWERITHSLKVKVILFRVLRKLRFKSSTACLEQEEAASWLQHPNLRKSHYPHLTVSFVG